MSKAVPNGWIKADLEYFSEVNPRLTKKNELTNDTEVSFLRMEDVSNFAKVKNKGSRKYSEVSKGFTCFQDHDVLVAKITPCFENGKGGYVVDLRNGVGFGSTEFHVLRANEKSDSRYIYHFTNYKSFRLEGESNMTGSAGQRRVPTDFFKTYQAIFPPLPEQQKIASILTAVDDVIESTQAQINKLKDLKTGMMQELLTKGIGHTEFKDSPVGRIPKTWKFVKFDAVVTKVGSGITPSGGSAVYTSSGIPFIRSQNIYKEGIRWDDICFISEVQHRKMANSQLKPKDVLLNITGASIGRCYYLPDDFDQGNVNQHVCIIRCEHKLLQNIYLTHYINSDFGQKQIMNLQAGGNREGLNFQQIRAMEIPLPSLVEQMEISRIISSIEINIGKHTEKMNCLIGTKKALMQDLLTGKVRVKVTPQ